MTWVYLLIAAILTLVGVGCLCYVRRRAKITMYTYRNIAILAVAIFLFAMASFWLFSFIYLMSADEELDPSAILVSAINTFLEFAFIVRPLAILLAIFLIIGSLALVKRWGFAIINTLGFLIGILMIGLTIFAQNPYEIIGNFMDVHSYEGYITESFLENVILVTLTYFECLMAATFFFTIKAGRHLPRFDKDYMIILGCNPGPGPELGNELRGRVDVAIDFARRQEAVTGKKLKFVPSGGQGADERTSEASAMFDYLVNQEIPKSHILPEKKSTSTRQNMQFSAEVIRKDWNKMAGEPKVAFATTGYHVLRSGMIATSVGLDVEGVGSRLKWYYYLNAALREFIAEIMMEKWIHLINITIISLVMLALTVATA